MSRPYDGSRYQYYRQVFWNYIGYCTNVIASDVAEIFDEAYLECQCNGN